MSPAKIRPDFVGQINWPGSFGVIEIKKREKDACVIIEVGADYYMVGALSSNKILKVKHRNFVPFYCTKRPECLRGLVEDFTRTVFNKNTMPLLWEYYKKEQQKKSARNQGLAD